jgi:betaine-homocysteine S-methyltransferase
MAEASGRAPSASRYTADMSKHAYLGADSTLLSAYQQYGAEF